MWGLRRLGKVDRVDLRLDLDGFGASLDPVDDWHELDDTELALALAARGCLPPALFTIVERRDDDDTARRLDRYFDTA